MKPRHLFTLKPYISLLRVRLLSGLQYRAAALGGLATQLFWGLMLVFIYGAFYAGGAGNDFDYRDLVSLVWLQQAFLAIVMLYDWDGELIDMITQGGIGYELIRPVHIYWLWYVKLLSKRLSRAVLRFPPIVITALLIPAPYGLSPPESPLSLLLFAVTLTFGLLLITAVSMLVYLSIFATMSPVGSIGILGIIGEFFSGATIPVPLMPLGLQRVCYTLPFRWIGDFPYRVYSGNIAAPDAVAGACVQLLWITVLMTAGVLFAKRITLLSSVQGG